MSSRIRHRTTVFGPATDRSPSMRKWPTWTFRIGIRVVALVDVQLDGRLVVVQAVKYSSDRVTGSGVFRLMIGR